jgi:hypothetical protein
MATRTRTAKKVAAGKKRPRRSPQAKARASATKTTTTAAPIRSWEDDPGSPDSGQQPVDTAAPGGTARRLGFAIEGTAPAAKRYNPGSVEFRYWAAAEAMARGTAFWRSILPARTKWHSTVGSRLRVSLDEGEDFNAYYDRKGLHFFHGTAGGRTVYSGESPDVVCHEMGHAVLDAARPQLFGANFIEAAAFHESFGDVSALLSALQLEAMRSQVLVETSGHLYASSRLSRLAEQLGWAIRQIRPDAVERDCLRNAVNSFFYADPQRLPPAGPASTLSSEPHSFSRVYTAAFLDALAGIHALQDTADQAGLHQATRDAALLLVDAISHSPVVPSYYSQVAAHMVESDADLFGGRYSGVLKNAFVRHGVLSLDSANSVFSSPRSVLPPLAIGDNEAGADATPLIPLPGGRYGLDEELLVHASAETRRFVVAGAAPDMGAAEPPAHDAAAQSFVEDLFRRGRVDVRHATNAEVPEARPTRYSHAVIRRSEGLVLVRNFFDAGVASDRDE